MEKIIYFIFLFFLNLSTPLNAAKTACEGKGAIAPTARLIAEWMANNFSNVKQNCKSGDVFVYGLCFAGLFGDQPFYCPVKYASGPLRALPHCAKILTTNGFNKTVGPKTQKAIPKSMKRVEMSIENAKTGVDFGLICSHLEEYVSHRINASEGGHYNKSKMGDYCSLNQGLCATVDKFTGNLTGNLKHLINSFFVDDPDKLTNENAVNKTVERLGLIYRHTGPGKKMDEEWLNSQVVPCFQEFFEVFSDKVGSG